MNSPANYRANSCAGDADRINNSLDFTYESILPELTHNDKMMRLLQRLSYVCELHYASTKIIFELH